jgi:hypothetical protein
VSQFKQYARHGWALCQIYAGEKKPRGEKWNTRENAITDPEHASGLVGAGLQHAFSGTCAIDVDHYDMARHWLKQRGIDLDALFAADDAVQITRGDNTRGKLLYRLPEPLCSQVYENPAVLPTKQIKEKLDPAEEKPVMILEFRCGATTGNSAQDVLPPTVHPSGQPYAWKYNDPLVSWEQLPLLPTAVLTLWQSMVRTPPKESPVRDSQAPVNAELGWVRDLLAKKDPDCDYDTWRDIGMRLHDGTGGGADGFDLWDAWSAKGSKYPGTDALQAKWDSFGQGTGPKATLDGLRREVVATDEDFGAPVTEQYLDVLAEAEKAAKAARAMKLTPLREFARPERVNYLVEDMIEQGQLIGFIGKRKGGKTYAALALSFAVAQGTEWGGHKVLASGPVVWIAAEGARSLAQRRAPQWLAHHGDADIRVWPKPLNMRSADTYDALLDVCRDAKLIVIDSLRRVTPGAKENSSDELGEVLAYAERLSLETGATVCIIAHASNKSDAEGDEMTARGSSVIEDQLEAGFFIEKLDEKVDDFDIFRITPGFARDEETGAGAAMHFKLVEVAPAGMVPGVVVDWNAKPAKKKVTQPDVRSSDKLAINTLNSLWPVDGDPVIDMDAFLGKYAESLVFNGVGQDNRITRAGVALDGLTKRGLVDVDNVRKTITLLNDTRVKFGPAPQQQETDPDADLI